MNVDPRFNGQIFRKSHPMIIAQNRRLASLLPVRLAYNASGYSAGQVLGQNSVSNNYENYNNAGASGLDTAQCVLFEDVDVSEFAAASGTVFGRGIYGGEVFYDKLIGLDAPAIVDLKARVINDSTGIKVLKF